MNATRWVSLTIGKAQPVSDGQRRYVRIAQAAAAALAGKGVSAVVGFISVPLTVGYLGSERYGVWITISTLLAWLNIADLGLGNSLTNALSEAYGKNRTDLAQRYVATSFWILVGLAGGLGGIFAVVWHWVDWVGLFNVVSPQAREELAPTIALALGIFLLNFPLSIVAKTYAAYQEGAIANYWAIAANVTSLFALIVVTQLHGGLVLLVAAFSGSLLLVTAASAVWLFAKQKPWLVPSPSAVGKDSLRKLGRVSGMFFVVQLAALLIYQTDNLIIAHFLGASQVTPYSVTWRLFSFTTMLQSVVFPFLWPAYTEAFARGDGAWIRRTLRINVLFGTIVTTLLVSPLVFFGIPIIQAWAGVEAVPPVSLLVWMGLWNIVFSVMIATGCILNASGHLQGQMIYGTVTAVVNILLSIVFALSFGITGVIAATVAAYVICSVIPQSIETTLLLRRTAHGS